MKNYIASLFKTKNSENRLYLIDFLRGFTIINMILYHAVWDMVYLLDFNIPWFKGNPGFIWQQAICYSFILISGFCINLSKNGFKGGIVVFICGIIVSAVTFLFMPENSILFGILTFLGSAMIVTVLFIKPLKRVNSFVGLIINILLFIILRHLNDGYIGLYDIFTVQIPVFLYNGYFASFIGFTDKSFISADYFSILPWIFLFLTGYYFGRIVKIEEKGKEYGFLKMKIPILNYIGQHSLIIYLVHQPILYVFTLIYNSL